MQRFAVLFTLGTCLLVLVQHTEADYIIPDFEANWHQANEYCFSIGKRLAITDSQERHNAVVNEIKNSPVFNNVSTHIWIGASDLGKEGTFYWHATGKKVTFINWRWDNPDNENNVEHCVSLLSVPNEKWDWHANDQSCDRMHHFVCEDFRTLLGIVVPLKK